LVLVPQ